MKILFAGDTHGNINHIRYLLDHASNNDCAAIFQLGDFGYWEHTNDGVQFLDQVSKLAHERLIPIYFLDGNHDKTSLLLNKYQEQDSQGFTKIRSFVYYAPRGHRWTWGNTRFIALGGAYSVDKPDRLRMEEAKQRAVILKNSYRPPSAQKSTDTSGTLWFPEEEMTDADMDQILSNTYPVDVILAHDKPRASSPQWNRKDFPECLPNQDRLQKAVTTLKPKLFLHGHLHYRYKDVIRCGDDDQWTMVIGLDADSAASYSTDRRDSWIVINIDEISDSLLI